MGLLSSLCQSGSLLGPGELAKNKTDKALLPWNLQSNWGRHTINKQVSELILVRDKCCKENENTRAGYFPVGLISWVVQRIKCINVRNVLSLEPARE